MKLCEGVASFCCFVKTSIFFHPLNWNDDLKESGVGVGVGLIGILGVGVGVGILGKLGVGVGPYTFRHRNPGFMAEKQKKIFLIYADIMSDLSNILSKMLE